MLFREIWILQFQEVKEEKTILEIFEKDWIHSMMYNLNRIREKIKENLLKIKKKVVRNKERTCLQEFHRSQIKTGRKLRPQFFG